MEKQIEVVGKVFVVVGGKRRCLICDGIFTPRGAANHATAPRHPRTCEGEAVPMIWDA